jgi:hypothetical protein
MDFNWPPGCQKRMPSSSIWKALLGAADVDVALGRQRGGRPGGGLKAVRQGAVVVAAEPVHTRHADGPVGVHRDDGAHLLQDADQVLDLRFHRGVRELGDTFGEDGRQQDLLGRADGRVRQRDLRTPKPPRCLQELPVRALLDRRAELPQHLEVEVDGPAADVTAAEAGDEGMTETVQQRTAQQDRDAAGTRVGIDVSDVRALDVRRVHHQLARFLTRTDRHPVQLQQSAYDPHVTDVRNVAQSTRLAAQQGGDHGLRYEVLRTADSDLALQRGSAVDNQYVVRAVDGHVSRVPMSRAGGRRERVIAAHPPSVSPSTAQTRHSCVTTRTVPGRAQAVTGQVVRQGRIVAL